MRNFSIGTSPKVEIPYLLISFFEFSRTVWASRSLLAKSRLPLGQVKLSNKFCLSPNDITQTPFRCSEPFGQFAGQFAVAVAVAVEICQTFFFQNQTIFWYLTNFGKVSQEIASVSVRTARLEGHAMECAAK